MEAECVRAVLEARPVSSPAYVVAFAGRVPVQENEAAVTVTVRLWIPVATPAVFQHWRLYVVVEAGETLRLPFGTVVQLSMPPPEIQQDWALEVVQARFEEFPATMEAGVAVKLLMVAAGTAAAFTVSVLVTEVAEPPGPVQVTDWV